MCVSEVCPKNRMRRVECLGGLSVYLATALPVVHFHVGRTRAGQRNDVAGRHIGDVFGRLFRTAVQHATGGQSDSTVVVVQQQEHQQQHGGGEQTTGQTQHGGISSGGCRSVKRRDR